MEYIVVWRNTHKEPHLSMDTHGFLETYPSYDDAKKAVEQDLENVGEKDIWFFDYKIYKVANP
jgi:hypothetical protein